jgi:hypothetical protein
MTDLERAEIGTMNPLLTPGQSRILLCFLTIILLVSGVMAAPSNKWRLQFSGKAHSSGTIVFRISPQGGIAMVVEANIKKGTGENAVAKQVVKAFRAQLPEDDFHVERDDGEDVLLKKRRGRANFDVEIISNNVKNVRINPDRE